MSVLASVGPMTVDSRSTEFNFFRWIPSRHKLAYTKSWSSDYPLVISK